MKHLTLTLSLILGLAGCGVKNLEGPPAALAIKNTDTTLIGRWNHKSLKNGHLLDAELEVTDGNVSCSGTAQYSTTDLAPIPLTLNCSDGTNGKAVVVLNRATYLKDFTGVGKGKLSNGEQFQIIIGPLEGSISW